MKKLLTTIALVLIACVVMAQNPTSKYVDSILECRQIVNVDSMSASKLYVRTLEVLSDWAGAQARSRINVDVQDKDEGLIVYKGSQYIGYRKANLLYGWNTFADFTLKVRCKDNRVQIIMTVPTMTFDWDGSQVTYTLPLSEFLPEYRYEGKLIIKKAARELSPSIPSTIEAIVSMISTKISHKDDDF